MKNSFIKLYLNQETVQMFWGMSGTEMLLLLEMVRTMSYKNEMVWTTEHRSRFCRENGICLNRNGSIISICSFSNFMRSLCRKNFISKLNRNRYIINPKVFLR